jgi:hypothetical protein
VPYATVNDQILLLVGRVTYGRDTGHWSGFTAPRQNAATSSTTSLDVAAAACSSGTLGLLCDELSMREMLAHIAQPVHVPGGTFYMLPVPFDTRLPRVFQSVRRIVHGVAVDARGDDFRPPCLSFDALAWVPLFSDTYGVRFRTPFWADLHRIRRALSVPRPTMPSMPVPVPVPVPAPMPAPAPTPAPTPVPRAK